MGKTTLLSKKSTFCPKSLDPAQNVEALPKKYASSDWLHYYAAWSNQIPPQKTLFTERGNNILGKMAGYRGIKREAAGWSAP
jgi:hypothetical protein